LRVGHRFFCQAEVVLLAELQQQVKQGYNLDEPTKQQIIFFFQASLTTLECPEYQLPTLEIRVSKIPAVAQTPATKLLAIAVKVAFL
jgi:hypothetical protein